MYYEAEYETFLRQFNIRHGYMRPSSFEEWKCNIDNVRIKSSHSQYVAVHRNVYVPSTIASNISPGYVPAHFTSNISPGYVTTSFTSKHVPARRLKELFRNTMRIRLCCSSIYFSFN